MHLLPPVTHRAQDARALLLRQDVVPRRHAAPRLALFLGGDGGGVGELAIEQVGRQRAWLGLG